ncbi:MAG: phosphoribosylformylglycinamidine cyclo-ligase [Calditrichaeota bacterium]|nr:MAG: phosphoribosylformylglycinamidine cyclo-ligase [Calditrichota bacterium]
MAGVTYKDSGVNRAVSERAKDTIKALARETFSDNVLRDVGLFSGFYQLPEGAYAQPVLVSSIDGVGTKVKVAQMAERYDTIGEDLVNHCVNDIMVSGADPLFFLDYFAADSLDDAVLAEVVSGIARACKQNGCALIGGETAEMPGVYGRDSFDLAGAMIGLIDKEHIVDGRAVEAGDVLLGIASNGLHTNGYSLVRRVLFEEKHYEVAQHLPELGATLGEELLRVHRSYARVIREVRRHPGLHGMAHITGGGLLGNVSRLLGDSQVAQLVWDAWPRPRIFVFLQKEGAIAEDEMREVFNLGIGLVLVVAEKHVPDILDRCKKVGETCYIIGSIVET